MSLLKTKKAIDAINSGETLEVLVTDPGSKKDRPGWCHEGGTNFWAMLKKRVLPDFILEKVSCEYQA